MTIGPCKTQKTEKTFYIVLITVFLVMITSKYIDIIYLTGDLVLICKYCYYLSIFEKLYITIFLLAAKGM